MRKLFIFTILFFTFFAISSSVFASSVSISTPNKSNVGDAFSIDILE